MGFGLVFIGYMFMYSFPYKGLDILPDILGFIISYFGVKTLADYGCGWELVKRYYYLLIPAGGVTLVLQIQGMSQSSVSFVNELWNYFYTALLLVYNIMLLVAIYRIALDTEVFSIKAKASRNLVLGVVYYAIMLIISFPIEPIQKLKDFLSVNYAFGLLLYIFGYVWQFLNLALIFSCYMWICNSEDKDMPFKEPKIFKIKKKSDEEDDV